MYALYKKTYTPSGDENYKFERKIHLFGCKSGWIPWLLTRNLDKGDTEPFPWHIEVSDVMRKVGNQNGSLIINLKPNNSEPNLSLYEIANIWGYSNSGWTPIMLHLRGLFIDENPNQYDDKRFTRHIFDVDDPIFSVSYMVGSVENGIITGTWKAPPRSPTNSVLLWPETLDYFVNAANRIRERYNTNVEHIPSGGE